MLYIVQRAFLSSDIIVPDDMLPVQMILADQPCGEVYERGIRRFRKPSAVVEVTVLNRDRQVVHGVGCVSDLSRWHALDDLALQSDNKIVAHRHILQILQAFKIVVVLLGCRLRIAKVMHDDILDRIGLRPRSGPVIDREQLLKLAEPLMKTNYGQYLVEIANGLG